MLRWRLIVGTFLVALLISLCWLDVHATRPGVYLTPLAIVLCLLATREMIELVRSQGRQPVWWTTYLATLAPVLASCATIALNDAPEVDPTRRLAWLVGGLIAGLLLAILGEMIYYKESGSTITNLGSTSLSILYVGGLLGFLVQLRLLDVCGNVSRGGMLALLATILVVKSTDMGGYIVGRLWGRHKLAPSISPGKTWEGLAGGLAMALLAAVIALGPLARLLGCSSGTSGSWLSEALVYGIAVSCAGIFGDLAESLFKRDAGVKDSSTWLPGLGGVLDILDSLLVAAPVAYFCWVFGIVGAR